MKVLYLGHFLDGRGWRIAAENYVRALLSVGIEVVCRPVVINGNGKPSDDTINLFNKPVAGCTHVIQHVMPHFWDFSSKVKNIGLFVTETDTIKYTHWENKIRSMDQVWVPNSEMEFYLLEDFKTVSPYIVPHACDSKAYEKTYPKLNIGFNDRYIFYFIGENIRRKRINAILHAYNTAFDINDNVFLLVKTGRSGQSPQDSLNEINDANNKIKQSMRLYKNNDLYPEMGIMVHDLPEEEINGLHQLGNCFVNASFGDAWNQPCFDAYAFGNSVISPFHGGMADFLRGNYEYIHHVEFNDEVCFGADPFLPDLHTGRELWCNTNVADLATKMRLVYDLNLRDKCEVNKVCAKKYSYENVGKLMVENLETP